MPISDKDIMEDRRVHYDTERLDEAVLALLWLNLDTTGTAWKGFDWSAMERLHDRNLITDPVRKSKSVLLTHEGLAEGEHLFREFFTRPPSRAADDALE